MSSLLFEARPLDPATYAVVALTLLAATAAAYISARGITRIKPVEALKSA
jgi:ABC-type antimicrobial peptide transport system permease subunit